MQDSAQGEQYTHPTGQDASLVGSIPAISSQQSGLSSAGQLQSCGSAHPTEHFFFQVTSFPATVAAGCAFLFFFFFFFFFFFSFFLVLPFSRL
jgi:hypothetical protein